MRVIARKKIGIGLLYALFFFCSLFMMISAMFSPSYVKDDLSLVICSPVLFIISLINLIRFFSTPFNVIHYDSENNKLHFPKGESIYLADIISVDCKNAKNRHREFRWGKVIITTAEETYKFNFIAECEEVVYEIELLRK